ncbi:MAG: AMP-binding protein [Rhodospirillales bacterium]|nr:AMP-binding protein [Rhodospirillales bacterium]
MPFYDEKVETLPREELQALQLDKLQAMANELWGKNQFYTNKWKAAGVTPEDIKSLDDLSKLPLTLKSELVQDQEANAPYGTNLTYPLRDYVRFHQTSGTTGKPLKILDTEEGWSWWGKCWAHVLSGAGVTADDRIFLAFGFGPFVGFWASVEGARLIGATMIPGGARDSLQRLELMKEAEATSLACTPTYAIRLGEVARENGFDLSDIPITSTIHAGEPGANIPSTKKKIENTWSAKCFDHAGATEVGAHSYECEVQPGGTHLIESEYIAEILSPETLEPVAPGERGELVITNLGRWGFPVIRYRTGDVVKYNIDKCECGRTHMRFDGGVIGRADDMVTVRGVNVYPAAVENIIRQFDEVDEFRITVSTINHMDEMDVELELVENAVDTVMDDVKDKLYTMLGFRPKLALVARETLPRFELKAKRFHVKKQDAA